MQVVRFICALVLVSTCVVLSVEPATADWDGAYPQVAKKRHHPRPMPGPLGDHPRLWLTPERLDNIRAKACIDAVGNPIPGCVREAGLARFIDGLVPNSYWEKRAWHYALAYVVTGYRHHAHMAISAMDTTIATITNQDRGQGNFLSIAANLRDTALVYDWCYDVLRPNQRLRYVAYMNQLMQELWNPFDNPTHLWNGWAVDDPGNNFYYSFIAATAYAALAMYGDNPNPPGLAFNGTTYTDMLEFVCAKIEQESIPLYLNTWGVGGSWHEGNNYGLLSKRYLFEAFMLLRDVAGHDYFQLTSFPTEALRYHLYSMQPGFGRVYPGGDLPRSTQPYDRALMLLAADALEGTVEAEYAQFFVANIETSEPWVQWPFLQPWDVLLFDPDRPQRDLSELPTSYFAEGGDWVNSRSSWNNDAVSVSFVCSNRIQGHQAQDQNAFLIYKNGFQATHGNLYSTWGGYQNTDAYNTLLINGTGQAYGGSWSIPTQTVRDIGKVCRYESDPAYTYANGDASDAYYTNAGQFGNGVDRLLDTFTRELVHIFPGYVVVYDRVTPKDPAHIPTWLLNTANQPSLSGNRLTAVDGARLSNWVMLPPAPAIMIQPHPGGYTYGAPDTIQSWRTAIEPVAAQPNHVFLNVLFVTDVADTSLPMISLVHSQSGNMVGVEISHGGAGGVVLFDAAAVPGAPISDVVYDVGVDAVAPHLLFGLAPDSDYDVAVTPIAEGKRVTVAPAAGGNPVHSSAAGTLQLLTGNLLVAPATPAAAAPEIPLGDVELMQNQPNPFNPTTTISLRLPAQCRANLSVYDASGALVRTLIDESLPAGPKSVTWDGRDRQGRTVSSGVYFYRLSTDSRTMTRKMVFLK